MVGKSVLRQKAKHGVLPSMISILVFNIMAKSGKGTKEDKYQ